MGVGSFFTSKLDEAIGWARKYSIFQYPFVTACCGMEYMAAACSHYDVDRFGAGLRVRLRTGGPAAPVIALAGGFGAIRFLFDAKGSLARALPIEPRSVVGAGDIPGEPALDPGQALVEQLLRDLAHDGFEAGLRTGRKYDPFPEEINRRLATQLTDFHFAATEEGRKNLLSEGISPTDILVTGNTVIDALHLALKKVRTDPPEVPGLPAGKLGGARAVDVVAGKGDGEVSAAGRLRLRLEALSGKTLLVRPPR